MVSILREVASLRNGKPIVIDYKNSNRYCVVLQEGDGSKTAYCFSAPVYNISTRKAVDLRFEQRGNIVCGTGSNADITISNDLRLENAEGCCVVTINKDITHITEYELKFGSDVLLRTTNGVAYKAGCKHGTSFSFDLEVDKPFMEVRGNDKCFALMQATFRPFVSVSCIGTANSMGEMIAPATVAYQKIRDCQYRITVTPCSPLGEWVMFEINLYEPKLFQDTTVESMNPKTNNAFGTTAFIGNTAQFGEQWLYSRLDYARLPELMDKRICKAVLYLPKYNRANVELSAFKVSARFCSFGSNWNNKIALATAISDTSSSRNHQLLDITGMLTASKSGYMTRSEGLILRSRVKGSGFSAIATGDSCYTPQVLEINFK